MKRTFIYLITLLNSIDRWSVFKEKLWEKTSQNVDFWVLLKIHLKHVNVYMLRVSILGMWYLK